MSPQSGAYGVTLRHWHHYQEVNAHFATIAAEECGGKRALVWLQDCHLALCPALLRQRLPDLAIMHFWHVPWPPWELYQACPWRRELLGNDLLGFHLAQYCHNFLECAKRVLGASVDCKAGVVEYEGRETWVRLFPISIDYAWWTRLARGRRVARQIVRLRAQPDLAFPILGLGVDRLDYTKGIVHRFEAIERLLEKYPEYQGRFGFVQIVVPSRTQIEDYRQVKAQVECAVERINIRFGIGTAKPIHYRYAHLEPAELVRCLQGGSVSNELLPNSDSSSIGKVIDAYPNPRCGLLLPPKRPMALTAASSTCGTRISTAPYP